MELKTCPNGHTYDPSISATCPICGSEAAPSFGMNTPNDGGHTIPLTYDDSSAAGVGSTMPINPVGGGVGSTMPVDSNGGWGAQQWNPTEPVNNFGGWADPAASFGGAAPAQGGYTPTEAVNYNKGGVFAKSQPLTGWLVCIDGVEKGKDYRLHEEYNYIGRSPKMDVCIAGDGSVSWERHAIIAYDREERMFFFAPSSGGSIVRHNGRAVLNNVQLKSGDQLKIGNSTFLFVPFCGEHFQWEA